MGYLCDHTDMNLTPAPLMEVVMELTETELVFTPALDFSSPNSFLNLVEDVIADILHQGTLVHRVKRSNEEHYLQDIERTPEIADMKSDVEERVQSVMNQAYEYTMRFEPYTYLWEDDRADFLAQFLKYGHQLTPEEIEAQSLGEVINID